MLGHQKAVDSRGDQRLSTPRGGGASTYASFTWFLGAASFSRVLQRLLPRMWGGRAHGNGFGADSLEGKWKGIHWRQGRQEGGNGLVVAIGPHEISLAFDLSDLGGPLIALGGHAAHLVGVLELLGTH